MGVCELSYERRYVRPVEERSRLSVVVFLLFFSLHALHLAHSVCSDFLHVGVNLGGSDAEISE